jgi:hypothetical protein
VHRAWSGGGKKASGGVLKVARLVAEGRNASIDLRESTLSVGRCRCEDRETPIKTRRRAIGRPATFVSERTPFIGERPGRAPRRPELRSRRRTSLRRRRSTPGRALGVLFRRPGSIRAPTCFIRRCDRVGIRRRELPGDSQSDTERRRMSQRRFPVEGGRSPIEGEERPATWIASDRERERGGSRS